MANGGVLLEPHVLKKKDKGHKSTDLKLNKKNIETISAAMKGVVNNEDGTGSMAWSDVVSISAKTGTTQLGGGLKTHAWFAGFAPSERPEVAFVVFLEHGGSGGDLAAVIARKAVEYWYKNR